MLTKLTIRNFKQFEEVEIELGDNVVLIGPNNSGKTSALQALALWELGVRKWNGRRADPASPGVALNRTEITAIPVPDAQHLWRDLRAAESPIEIDVEGVTASAAWTCPLRFTFANEESLYCVPATGSPPDAARDVQIAYLTPLSGLIANEDRFERGSIAVRIGQGRTAEVLRNLCLRAHELAGAWDRITMRVEAAFGARLGAPTYDPATGQIALSYVGARGTRLDISASGRGMQQTLLLLSHLELNRGAVLLLDEPDAHLETLRQGPTYDALSEATRESGGQLIVASHSEVLLDRAGDRDVLVAFVGRPHRIDDRAKSQVAKALKEIGFDQYALAAMRGWVLYLEGSTDLAILCALASILGHPARAVLERAFVRAIGGNQRAIAARHFFGLREAKPDLVGAILLDRDAVADETIRAPLRELRWRRREIESYLTPLPGLLVRWASARAQATSTAAPLLARIERVDDEELMRAVLAANTAPTALSNPDEGYWRDVKLTEDYLPTIFGRFFQAQQLPNLMNKSDYHVLARFMEAKDIDPEVIEKLDAIVEVANAAKPEGRE